MAPKIKEAMGVLSGAVETACGWAFIAVAFYALLFVNMTGNGTLYDAARSMVLDAAGLPNPKKVDVQRRVVPVRPINSITAEQNRMLMVPGEPDKEFVVTVAASQQPVRPAEQITDAPADATAGTNWQKHLNGSLRTFTVYGNGDQTSSASASAGSAKGASGAARASAPATSVAAATPATSGSAFHAGITAEARPGVSDHVSAVNSGAGDGVNNFR
jgi:hypothetical protein